MERSRNRLENLDVENVDVVPEETTFEVEVLESSDGYQLAGDPSETRTTDGPGGCGNHPPAASAIPAESRAAVATADSMGEVESNAVEPLVASTTDPARPFDAMPVEARFAARSWIFRLCDFVSWCVARSFGLASLVVMLALIATLPVLQFISLGYLFEVQGRLARGNPGQFGLMGLGPASRLGSLALGTWISLLPIRFLTITWYQANLIDPSSPETFALRVAQIVVSSLLVVNCLCAWFCGGRLRYFFWPVVAPVSLAVWALRKVFGADACRPLLKFLLDWISPCLVNDIANVPRIRDWFLPAIVLDSLLSGRLFIEARDGVWNFVQQWRPAYFFWLGFRGFFGSLIWLFLPTLFLILAAMPIEPGQALICGAVGVLLMTAVYLALPWLQVQFASSNRFLELFNLLAAYRAFRKTPLRHALALLLMFLLALPPFVLKIERVPVGLVWLLSVVFIVFSLPGRMAVAWAVSAARRRDQATWRLIRYPVLLVLPMLPLMFTGIFFFTQYISWNGPWSLFEHHVFLLPVPFWIGPLVEGS